MSCLSAGLRAEPSIPCCKSVCFPRSFYSPGLCSSPGKLLLLLRREDEPGLKELWHIDQDSQDDDRRDVESEGVAGGAGAGADQEVVGVAN